MNAEELKSALAQHCGTQAYYRHSLISTFMLTDGAMCFAENAGGGAFWLFDILATELAIRHLVKQRDIAFATLTVANNKGKLTVAEDEGIAPVFSRNIEYTDCPEGEWKFFMQKHTENGKMHIVCMIPNEY